MSKLREPIPEIDSLLATAVDGRLTESDRARLERLLEESDDARESYIEQVVLHAMLRWEHALPLGIEANHADGGTSDFRGLTAREERGTEGGSATGDSVSGPMSATVETPIFPVLLDAPTPSHCCLFRSAWRFFVLLLRRGGDRGRRHVDWLGIPAIHSAVGSPETGDCQAIAAARRAAAPPADSGLRRSDYRRHRLPLGRSAHGADRL